MASLSMKHLFPKTRVPTNCNALIHTSSISMSSISTISHLNTNHHQHQLTTNNLQSLFTIPNRFASTKLRLFDTEKSMRRRNRASNKIYKTYIDKNGVEQTKLVKKYKIYNKDLDLLKKEERLLIKYPDPNKPKRPPTTFNLFIKDWTAQNRKKIEKENLKTPVIWKLASVEYQNLSEIEKKEYKNKQKRLSDAYKEYKKDYKENEIENLEKWYGKAIELKKEKPPSSGRTLFISENKDRFHNEAFFSDQNKQVMKDLAEEWKTMEAERKIEYQDRAKADITKWREHRRQIINEHKEQ